MRKIHLSTRMAGLFFDVVIVLFSFSPALAFDSKGSFPTENNAVNGLHPQTKCPVMGGEIDKDMYVDVLGKRVYICCMACEDAIKAEPRKYIEKIERRGETVEDLQ